MDINRFYLTIASKVSSLVRKAIEFHKGAVKKQPSRNATVIPRGNIVAFLGSRLIFIKK